MDREERESFRVEHQKRAAIKDSHSQEPSNVSLNLSDIETVKEELIQEEYTVAN